MEKIAFIVHGKIRRRKEVVNTLTERFKSGFHAVFYETQAPRHAEELTRQAIIEGCHVVIAVGGDGTLNEVVNGYLTSAVVPKKKPIIGVLPYGTGNDFARGIGMTRSVDQLEQLIAGRSIRSIDAGALRFRTKQGEIKTRYFDNIADLGLGADVVAQVNGVNLRKKILGGKMIFFLTVLKTFLTFKHKNVTVQWEGFTWSGPLLSLVVANGVYFGSGFGIAPEANLSDGLFEVIILGKVSIIDYLKNIGKLRRSEKIDHPEVFYHRASKLSAFSSQKIIIVEADGETEGQAPLEFECLKGVLPFLLPGV